MHQEFMGNLESCKADILGLCRTLLWDRTELEDALQEVILQALRSFSRFAAGSDFRAWIGRIAVHTVYNINRKKRRFPALSAAPESASGGWEQELVLEETYQAILREPDRILADLDKVLRRELQRLNESERAALVLRSLCDLKYSEIAVVLKMPLGSVMGNIGRARAKLRKALARSPHEVQ